MKKLFLVLFLVPSLCFAQKNYCKKIKRKVDEDKGIITYKSPVLKSLSVMKQFKSNPFFGLMLRSSDVYDHADARGSIVEFEDGSILKDENVPVLCKQEISYISGDTYGSGSHSGEYVLQGFFHISDANIQKFVSKKIVRIQLDNVSQQIPVREATQIRNYIRCLRDLKI
jgi:hypothetical protein